VVRIYVKNMHFEAWEFIIKKNCTIYKRLGLKNVKYVVMPRGALKTFRSVVLKQKARPVNSAVSPTPILPAYVIGKVNIL
jgi:hypothetical protein